LLIVFAYYRHSREFERLDRLEGAYRLMLLSMSVIVPVGPWDQEILPLPPPRAQVGSGLRPWKRGEYNL